jgi:3-phenylpropionate/cinnamic acid dioxygenase small subunit
LPAAQRASSIVAGTTGRGFAMPSVLEDKDQIRELLATYCFHFDEGKFDDWIQLWTDDPVWDVDGRIARGREECLKVARAVESVDGKPPMKHYIMNEVIAVDGDKANVKCYVLVVRKRPDGTLVTSSAGYYLDKVVRQGSRWLFAERFVRRDYRFAGVP